MSIPKRKCLHLQCQIKVTEHRYTLETVDNNLENPTLYGGYRIAENSQSHVFGIS